MGTRLPELNQRLTDFIARQKMFFVATAGVDGFVNVSPKGMDSFRVDNPQCVSWLNLTGSGNESAAHVLENARMTIMFCAFEGDPMILRLYGEARVIHPYDSDWAEQVARFDSPLGARQIFQLDIKLVQTSCGFAVPFYQYEGDRDLLETWADKKGPEGIRQYWQDKNSTSLDGKPTGILA